MLLQLSWVYNHRQSATGPYVGLGCYLGSISTVTDRLLLMRLYMLLGCVSGSAWSGCQAQQPGLCCISQPLLFALPPVPCQAQLTVKVCICLHPAAAESSVESCLQSYISQLLLALPPVPCQAELPTKVCICLRPVTAKQH